MQLHVFTQSGQLKALPGEEVRVRWQTTKWGGQLKVMDGPCHVQDVTGQAAGELKFTVDGPIGGTQYYSAWQTGVELDNQGNPKDGATSSDVIDRACVAVAIGGVTSSFVLSGPAQAPHQATVVVRCKLAGLTPSGSTFIDGGRGRVPYDSANGTPIEVFSPPGELHLIQAIHAGDDGKELYSNPLWVRVLPEEQGHDATQAIASNLVGEQRGPRILLFNALDAGEDPSTSSAYQEVRHVSHQIVEGDAMQLVWALGSEPAGLSIRDDSNTEVSVACSKAGSVTLTPPRQGCYWLSAWTIDDNGVKQSSDARIWVTFVAKDQLFSYHVQVNPPSQDDPFADHDLRTDQWQVSVFAVVDQHGHSLPPDGTTVAPDAPVHIIWSVIPPKGLNGPRVRLAFGDSGYAQAMDVVSTTDPATQVMSGSHSTKIALDTRVAIFLGEQAQPARSISIAVDPDLAEEGESELSKEVGGDLAQNYTITFSPEKPLDWGYVYCKPQFCITMSGAFSLSQSLSEEEKKKLGVEWAGLFLQKVWESGKLTQGLDRETGASVKLEAKAERSTELTNGESSWEIEGGLVFSYAFGHGGELEGTLGLKFEFPIKDAEEIEGVAAAISGSETLKLADLSQELPALEGLSVDGSATLAVSLSADVYPNWEKIALDLLKDAGEDVAADAAVTVLLPVTLVVGAVVGAYCAYEVVANLIRQWSDLANIGTLAGQVREGARQFAYGFIAGYGRPGQGYGGDEGSPFYKEGFQVGQANRFQDIQKCREYAASHPDFGRFDEFVFDKHVDLQAGSIVAAVVPPALDHAQVEVWRQRAAALPDGALFAGNTRERAIDMQMIFQNHLNGLRYWGSHELQPLWAASCNAHTAEDFKTWPVPL